MRKPNVLVLADYYLPGYKSGGPIQTLAAMVEQLGDECAFRLITRDREKGDPGPYAGCRAEQWQRVGNAEVLYLPPQRLTLRTVQRVIRRTEHDVLYLNSLFSPVFAVRPLVLRRLGLIPRRPVILAPRGELAGGALAIKRDKKRAYLRGAKAAGLYRHVAWQASSEAEAADVRRCFGRKATVFVAPNVRSPGAGRPHEAARHAKQPGTARIFYLARMSRNKNLLGALEMLRDLQGRVEFDIYGPQKEPDYWAQCRRAIDALPANVRVKIHGPVPHDEVPGVMRRHELMLLPTWGENFGHVIQEALLAGCLVLISDRTPWRGLAGHDVGWDLPLERPDRFRAVLEQCIEMGDQEFQERSRKAMDYGRAVATNPDVLAQNREMFRHVAAAVRRAA